MALPSAKEKRKLDHGLFQKGLDLGKRIAYLEADGSFSGGITDADFAATNQDAITLANNQSDGKFAISVNTTGSNHTVTLKAPVTTQTVALTLPDIAADTLVSKTSTDTLTNKTLTAPTITGAVSLNGAVTISGTNTFTTGTGNITLKGDVSIDGGKDFDMSAGAGTFATGTGTATIGGDLEVASDIDTTGASALTIGSSAATSVTVGAVDIETTVQSSALLLDSTAAATLSIDGVDVFQYDDAAISGFAADSDEVGLDFYAETQDGGASTSGNPGQAGGAFSLKTGDGSQGYATENEDGDDGGALTFTAGDGGNAGLVVSGTANGGVGGAIAILAGDGGEGGDESGTDGDGGEVSIDSGAAGTAGSATSDAGEIYVGATNAKSIYIGNAAATTILNGVVMGEAEGYMVHGLVVDVSAAEVNAGHVIVTVPTGRQFQLVNLEQIAIGGTAAGATAITVAGSATIASTTAATLVENALVGMHTSGVTLLVAGASFTAQTAGTDISVGRTDSDLITATSIRFIISYLLI